MKLSTQETKILEQCCMQYDINPKVLMALFLAESEGYFANDSQKSKVVAEMVKIIEFWSQQHSGDVS